MNLPKDLEYKEKQLLYGLATQEKKKDNINGIIEQDDEYVHQILNFYDELLDFIYEQENLTDYTEYLLNFHHKFQYDRDNNYLYLDQSYEGESLGEFFWELDEKPLTKEFIQNTKEKVQSIREQLP